MPHTEHDPGGLGGIHHGFCACDIAVDGFFHEDVFAFCDQGHHGFMVQGGRDSHGEGIALIHQVVDSGKGFCSEFSSDFFRSSREGIVHAHQFDFAVFAVKFRVKTPENTRSDNTDFQFFAHDFILRVGSFIKYLAYKIARFRKNAIFFTRM